MRNNRYEAYIFPILIFIFAGAVHGSISGIAGAIKFHAAKSPLQEAALFSASINYYHAVSFLIIAAPLFFLRRFKAGILNFLYVFAGYLICRLASTSVASTAFSALTFSSAFDNLEIIFFETDFIFEAVSGLAASALFFLFSSAYERLGRKTA